MDKGTLLLNKVAEFMNENNVTCEEDVYQRESVEVECLDLVASLVGIMLEE